MIYGGKPDYKYIGYMKFFIRILLALIIPTSAMGQAQIPLVTAQAEELEVGSIASLAISLANEGDEVYNGFQFDLVLPEGITLASEEGNITLHISDRYQARDIAARVRAIGEGCYRLIAYSLSDATISGHEGILVTLTLQGSDDLEGGEQRGNLKEVVLSRADGMGIECEASEFLIKVPGTMMGDVNFDHSVDVTDVMLVVGQILGETNSPFFFKYADMNKDGIINVTDVMRIVGVILNTQVEEEE